MRSNLIYLAQVFHTSSETFYYYSFVSRSNQSLEKQKERELLVNRHELSTFVGVNDSMSALKHGVFTLTAEHVS
jgi:hypothetical protein